MRGLQDTARMIVGSQDINFVTGALIAFASFCLGVTIIRSFQQRVPQGLKKPPGPMGYPLIGNILELGNCTHLSLTRMSQKYGDVMKIHIGTTPVLVISGLETVKQALVKQGKDFMGRPDLYSFRQIAGGQSLTFGRDTESVWRARKKLVQNALKTFSASPSPTSSSTCLLEEHISKEVDCLVTKLQQVMKEKECFEPFQYIMVSAANVICAICLGKRYSHDDQELLSIMNMLDDFEEIAAAGSPPDFIPILRYFPNPAMEKFKELNKRFLTFFQKYVNEHYEDFNEDVVMASGLGAFKKGLDRFLEEKSITGYKPSRDNIRDITDSLIAQSQGKKSVLNSSIQLPEEKVVNLVNDLVGASFETMTTAFCWCIMYLVAFPETQKKIQKELDQTIGRERKPRLSDWPMLPYLEAFILEACRHSTFLPFAIPHCTTKATVLNGFYIPKDMCVFINQWTLWKSPSSFRPERFLTANRMEINREESEKVLIFGLGKRRCLGEHLARLELFLFLAILLHQLEFSVSEGEEINLTPRYGLVLKLERCEHIQVKERLSKS